VTHTKEALGNLPPCISQLPDEMGAKFLLLPPFSTTAIPMGILPDISRSGKLNKLVISIYKVVDEIILTLCFRCLVTH